MREIFVNNTTIEDTINELNVALGGELIEQWGEYTLSFKNEFGEGTIRSIGFDWGLSLLDFDVNFKEVTKIVFKTVDKKLVEFIFISEGYLEYKNHSTEEFVNLERYQNIIVSSLDSEKKTFIFPKSQQVKVNFIQVVTKDYLKKKNNNVQYLDKVLKSVFKDNDPNTSFKHLGNYNLQIADQVKQLGDSYDNGVIRTLSIEGQLNLIMAMQILEHQNSESGLPLVDSISKDTIKKIQELSNYIIDHLADSLTIAELSKISGLGPKKIQLGFKMLYSKTVNEYTRDLKLEVARDQLTNSDLSISEIVYNIGFKSRSYFSKIFNERYGILPNEYRTKIKNKKA
ncbi:AraC family transcriptional regulator [uncultured Winogradskyella sp.]|uniref:helix-turn-helix domain-containing protein n=1 Tax=uncultured Winogradskyella sp. TaxID=395353 RepID=UPI002607A76B|nr:AraC family transcriptional regulator [uncultured Winogradskyella sp.]